MELPLIFNPVTAATLPLDARAVVGNANIETNTATAMRMNIDLLFLYMNLSLSFAGTFFVTFFGT
jgi:hypothetical protein